MDKHDTIGIDAVAMCVNDIACAGGEPLSMPNVYKVSPFLLEIIFFPVSDRPFFT